MTRWIMTVRRPLTRADIGQRGCSGTHYQKCILLEAGNEEDASRIALEDSPGFELVSCQDWTAIRARQHAEMIQYIFRDKP